MRFLPSPKSHGFAGHYATKLGGHWFALTDTRKGLGVALIYPPEIFRALWLWQSYGGWRDLYHLAVEPWVGYPVNLEHAVEAGRDTTLAACESVAYDVGGSVYCGLGSVGGMIEQGGYLGPVP